MPATAATEPKRQRPRPAPPKAGRVDHEGGTEADVGDRVGPGAGYASEPEKVEDKGGVADS